MNLERGFLCYCVKSYNITNLLYRALLQYFLAYSNDILDTTIQYDRSSGVLNVNSNMKSTS